MAVPAALAAALAAADAPAGLAAAVERLVTRYRDGIAGGTPAVRDAADRAAYLHARMPATAAAVGAALDALGLDHPASVLDLGSGPGSALWAAADRHPDVARWTAVERDPELAAAGRALLDAGNGPQARWIQADLRRLPALEPHDLVMASYCLNELTPPEAEAAALAAWALAGRALLVVEPGTPRGAALIVRLRTALLAAGAVPLAPCTHAGACPLEHGPGFCRFAVRLGRSRIHRAAKGGMRGFEDESYSYLAVMRPPAAVHGGGRIIAPPERRGDGIHLRLCSSSGLGDQLVPRRDPHWKTAVRAEWGDAWKIPDDNPCRLPTDSSG
jgi:ribosomal protein RSM22 (predicted rRNA methylase)